MYSRVFNDPSVITIGKFWTHNWITVIVFLTSHKCCYEEVEATTCWVYLYGIFAHLVLCWYSASDMRSWQTFDFKGVGLNGEHDFKVDAVFKHSMTYCRWVLQTPEMAPALKGRHYESYLMNGGRSTYCFVSGEFRNMQFDHIELSSIWKLPISNLGKWHDKIGIKLYTCSALHCQNILNILI